MLGEERIEAMFGGSYNSHAADTGCPSSLMISGDVIDSNFKVLMKLNDLARARFAAGYVGETASGGGTAPDSLQGV